jgi:hypothetical protein
VREINKVPGEISKKNIMLIFILNFIYYNIL